MSFIDHLEALRWHVIRAAISVVVFATGAFFAKDFLFHDLILGPSRNDFWTYRAFCRLGQWMSSSAEPCANNVNFVIQNREMSGQRPCTSARRLWWALCWRSRTCSGSCGAL
ncbi:twin-arginine translocase subunit TatC [Hymenobacter humi]|uniref:Twin-arginine translocase subunit TatC n=1 Tax=Hymenobacter humi TaxID=1411620 RepID=A0ABW2U303_9BACT